MAESGLGGPGSSSDGSDRGSVSDSGAVSGLSSGYGGELGSSSSGEMVMRRRFGDGGPSRRSPGED